MDDGIFAVCLLAKLRERNQAIGINQDTQLLRGLSAYVRDISREDMKSSTQRLVKAAWLKAMIDEHSALAKRLTDYIMANIEDGDIRNEGVYIMTKLDAYITHLSDELEALWQHS
jgi:hypothetical protein